MFPKLDESRVRDCYNVVGNSWERAMRVIVSEEQSQSNADHKENKFQAHIVSLKKKELSAQEERDLKKEISKRYFYYVDDPEKEHHPVVLVKHDQSSKKVSNIFDDDKDSDINVLDTNEVEDEADEVASDKKINDSKLNR